MFAILSLDTQNNVSLPLNNMNQLICQRDFLVTLFKEVQHEYCQCDIISKNGSQTPFCNVFFLIKTSSN